MRLRFAIFALVSFFSFFGKIDHLAALSYPVSTPAGETVGGTYRTYFDNIFANAGSDCDVYGQVVGGFTSSGVPNCVTPVSSGLFLSGQTTGDTIFFNGTDWLRTNNIFNAGANVGIGTQTPGAKLEVNGQVKITGGGFASGRILTSDAAGLAYWSDVAPNVTASGIIGGTQNYIPRYGFGGSGLLLSQIFDDGTHIGIGTATPSSSVKLDIIGDILVNTLRLGRGGGNILSNTVFGWNALNVNVTGTTNTVFGYGAFSSLTFGDGNIGIGNLAGSTQTSGSNNLFIGNNVQPNIGTAASNQLNIGNWIYGDNGNIGIGVLNPGARLEVNGQIKITGGTPGAGKVLTSDAAGLATWTGIVTATSLSITGASLGSTLYYDGVDWIPTTNIYNAGSNVGIGTAIPGAKLDVNGQIRISGGSPGVGKVLISDATGLASWQAGVPASSVDATNITGGVPNYITKFGSGGVGIFQSLLYETGGYIGLGNTNPTADLDISGQIRIRGGGPGAGRVLTSDATGIASWVNPSVATNVYATGVIGMSSSGGYLTKFMTNGSGITSALVFETGPYIGISTTTPSYTLDVNGTGNFLGFRLPTAAGAGKVLTSDASGNATWSASLSGATATGITGGVQNYVSKFGTGGNGIYASQIFDSGTGVGIATASPSTAFDVNGQIRLRTGAGNGLYLISDTNGVASWTGSVIATALNLAGAALGTTLYYNGTSWVASTNIYNSGANIGIGTSTPAFKLDVNGSGRVVGDLTVQGKLITDTIVNRTVNNVSISGSLLPDAGSPSMYRDIGSAALPWNNLYLGGQIKIAGGSPGLGKILTSDASGLATWSTYASGATATGITGGSSGYLSVFGAGGNGLYSSFLFQTGSTRLGINTINPRYMVDIQGSGSILNAGSGLCIDNTCINAWSGLNNLVKSTGTPNYIAKFDSGGLINNSQIYETGGKLYIGDIPGIIAGAATIGYITIESPGSTNSSNPFLTLSENGGQECRMWITGANKLGSNCSWSAGLGGSYSPYQIIKADVTGANLTGSMIYDNGTNVGIGMPSGAIANLSVSGTALVTGNLTVQGKLITDTIVNRTVNNVSISGSLLPDAASPTVYRDIGSAALPWNNLYLGGQIKIAGGSPGIGKILTSDASGLATWSTYASGATATGITGGSSGYLSVFGAGGNGLYSSLLFQTGSFIGLNDPTPSYTLDVNGTGSFLGFRLPTGAGAGKVLASDATGNATWTTGFSGTTTASGITGGTQNYVTKFGVGGNGIISSQIYDNGTNIGIGTTTPGTKFELNSGSGNASGFRFTQLTATSPIYGGVASPLGVDGSGNVVVAQQGAIPVYTALGGTPNAAINTTVNPPTIGANYDKYFTINARQSFAVTDVGGNPYNCPEFTIGTTNKGPTGCTATPWASYVMTAQNATSGNRYAYQILISDRTDAPFVVRGGTYDSTQGKLMNTARTIEALWFKALTVPTNHSDWLYVNPGVDTNNNAISGGGNVGIGTMNPLTVFEVFSGTTAMIHTRGANNTAFGFGSVRTALTGNANSGFGAESLFSLTSGYSNSAFGYKSLRTTGAGFNNSAFGQESLYNNNGGSWNSALGYQALYSNSSGTGNVGIGPQTLYNLSTGNQNIAIGYQAVRAVAGSAVSNNIGIGFGALYSTTASNLVALGFNALYSNTSGTQNTAIGYGSLDAVTTTGNNTALGFNTLTLTTGGANTALGNNAGSTLTTGSGNILIGSDIQALTATGNDQLNIGNWIYGNGGKIAIGRTSVSTGAYQVDIAGGYVNSASGFCINNSCIPSWTGLFSVLSGSGNYLPKWNAAGTGMIASRLSDDGTNISISSGSLQYVSITPANSSQYSQVLVSSGGILKQGLTTREKLRIFAISNYGGVQSLCMYNSSNAACGTMGGSAKYTNVPNYNQIDAISYTGGIGDFVPATSVSKAPYFVSYYTGTYMVSTSYTFEAGGLTSLSGGCNFYPYYSVYSSTGAVPALKKYTTGTDAIFTMDFTTALSNVDSSTNLNVPDRRLKRVGMQFIQNVFMTPGQALVMSIGFQDPGDTCVGVVDRGVDLVTNTQKKQTLSIVEL